MEVIVGICILVVILCAGGALAYSQGKSSQSVRTAMLNSGRPSELNRSQPRVDRLPEPDRRYRAFRSDAECRGLIVRGRENDEQRIHFFDLNSGQINALAEPDKLKELMQLACRYSGAADDGDCGAMLGLVALRTDVEKFEDGGRRRSLIWCRSSSSRTGDDWITFRMWLTEKGLMPTA